MTFQTEFPNFRVADMPAIPAGFEDRSWRNDACPTFINESAGLMLWIDFANPDDREHEDVKRFGLCEYNDGIGDEIVMTDDWSEVLSTIEKRTK